MSGGPGGPEVGRVSVRVVPNTKGFRKKVKRDLENIGPVKVDVDTSKVDKALGRLKSKIGKFNKSAAISVGGDTQTVKRTAKASKAIVQDAENLTKQAKTRAKTELNILRTVNKIKGEPSTDNTGFLRSIAAMRTMVNKGMGDRLEKLGTQPIRDNSLLGTIDRLRKSGALNKQVDAPGKQHDIKLNPSFSVDWHRKLQAGLEKANAGKRPGIKVGLVLDAAGEYDFHRRISKLGKKTKVKVETELVESVNNKGFASRISDGISKGLGKFKMPNFGSGINLTGYAVILGGVLAVLAPLVGVISAAAMSLPGLMAGFLIPVGALALGMEGITKAAEVLKPKFDDLKKSMSEATKAQFTPVFEKLRDSGVFELLKESLPKVTQGIADMADGVVNVISSKLGKERITSIIGNLGESLSAMKPGIEGFTTGILGAADELMKKSPKFAEWINTTGTSFANWIEKVSTDGSLGRAFEGLGSILKTVGEAVVDLGGKGIDFLSKPQNIENVKSALEGIKSLLNALMDASTWLWDMYGKLNKKAEKAQFPNGKENAGKPGGTDPVAVSGPNGLLGAMTYDLFSAEFEKIKQGWAQTWENMKIVAQGAWMTISAAAQAAWTGITGFISTAFSGIWNGITTSATAVWNGVVTFVSSIPGRIVAFFQQIPSQISGVLSGIPSIIGGAFSGAAGAVAGAIGQVVGAVITGGGQILAEVGSWPGKIAAALSSLAAEGMAAGAALVQGLINGISGMIGAAVAKAKELASSVANAAKSFLGINSPSKLFTEIGAYTAQGFGIGLATGFDPVIEQAKTLAQKIQDAFDQGLDLKSVLGGDKYPELTKTLDMLEEQRKALKVQLNNTSDKGQKTVLKDQMAQLQAQKDQLALVKDQLKNTDKYGNSVDDNTMSVQDFGSRLTDIGAGFASNVGDQFLGDLGIGSGAIPTVGKMLMDWGLNAGKKYVFNVNSMDEALAAKQNITNRESLQFAR